MNNRQNTANTPDAGCRINIAEKRINFKIESSKLILKITKNKLVIRNQ